MPTETEVDILRERLKEYRAMLEASFIVLNSPSNDAVKNYFKKLEEHGIITPKEDEHGQSNNND